MDKRVCSLCKTEKDFSEFGFIKKNHDIDNIKPRDLKSRCKSCENQYVLEYCRKNPTKTYRYRRGRKDEIKQWFLEEVKIGPCFDCGGIFPSCCMDYDHRDGQSKNRNLATLVGEGYSREIILAEVAKCDLICANCHRIRTQGRGWNQWDKCKRSGPQKPEPEQTTENVPPEG